MLIKKMFQKPLWLSTLLAALALTALCASWWILKKDFYSTTFISACSAILALFVIFNLLVLIRKRKKTKVQHIETEDEVLADALAALLNRSADKPVYLIIGNKGAGKATFLNVSNAIKPQDKKLTVKNDFFEWFESDCAVYIKPDQRLLLQDQSSSDHLLWEALIAELIRSRPRKPIAGCMLFCDLEYLVVHQDEQIEYTFNAIAERLEHVFSQISSALPVYLMISKLDKLEGFKEYITFSPLKSHMEFLSIPLKEAKGAIRDYFTDSFNNLVRTMEKNALDCTSQSSSADEKQAIMAFPKQFELCRTEVLRIIELLNSLNKGCYSLDLREIFFTSSLQGGRKYNLVAKSCSNYFNLPIIASEHSHLSETPYFTRFLVDSHVLPEIEYAGENKVYLRRLIRNSRLVMALSVCTLAAGGFLLQDTLQSNLRVINTLLGIESRAEQKALNQQSQIKLNDALAKIQPLYQAWIDGNHALDAQLTSLNLSRLEDATKIAYSQLLTEIELSLIPILETGYRLQLGSSQDNYEKTLRILKGYLMLKEAGKRDIAFLEQQSQNTLIQTSENPQQVNEAMLYLSAYFRSDFKPVDINMDLVRATRRHLMATSKVDMVYAQILQQAHDIDLGTLDIQRAVGFEFNNIFVDHGELERLNINKVYTSTGFSTFYRPRIDLLSQQVIVDNWVLGLSNQVIPTDAELDDFKTKVRKKYTDDYISYWRNALSELQVRRYDNIIGLTNAIDMISGPSSPLTTVLKQLFTNTKFSESGKQKLIASEKNQLLNKAIEQVSEVAEETIKPDYLLMSRVEQAFGLINKLQISETENSPTPWEEIVSALSQVRTYLKTIADAPDTQMAALAAAQYRMSSTETDPLIRLKQIAQKTPQPVRSWLMDIVNQTWAVMLKEAEQGVQTLWYSEVYTEFAKTGLNRYPFNRQASTEISLEEFEKLFAKGGTIDAFIQKNLSPFYDTNLWEPKRMDGEYLSLSPELLVQLQNYNTIRSTLINHSTNTFRVPFSIKVVDMDSSAIRATVNLADGQLAYYHGPGKLKELAWPPASGDFGISLTIQDVTAEGKQHNLSKEGQWAIYRLLDDSNLVMSNDGSFVSEVNVSGRELKLSIRPLTPNNPFTFTELFSFTLPEKINI